MELRPPSDADLFALVDLVLGGVHDPATMPFSVPWTDLSRPDLERGVLQYHWGSRAAWKPGVWDLGLAVVLGDEVVGQQSLHGPRFGHVGEISTGSWLGQRFQGRGIGREMRTAVVDFAFAVLGAREVVSAARVDNAASNAVSRGLGYEENGRDLGAPRGEPVEFVRWRLTRARWEQVHDGYGVPIAVSGLAECLEMFGVASRPIVATDDDDPKSRALRASLPHDFPAGDIDTELAEIDRGRGDRPAGDEP